MLNYSRRIINMQQERAISEPGIVERSNSPPKSRKTRSAPTPKPKVDQSDIIQPPITVTGEMNGYKITVYGEIHNLIDNTFYENLDLKNKIVMVEHSTALCEISKHHKEVLLNTLKGAEWIWYKYKARNRPVICCDNRIELGLLSAIEEKYLMNTNSNEDLQTIISYIVKSLSVYESAPVKKLFIGDALKTVYAKSIETIRRQLTILYNVRSFEIQGLLQIKDMLINNLIKLSSIIVDINIYQNVIKNITKQSTTQTNNSKEIVIFAGAAHAYRLHQYFPRVFTNVATFDNIDLKTIVANLELDKMVFEDTQLENKFLSVLRKAQEQKQQQQQSRR